MATGDFRPDGDHLEPARAVRAVYPRQLTAVRGFDPDLQVDPALLGDREQRPARGGIYRVDVLLSCHQRALHRRAGGERLRRHGLSPTPCEREQDEDGRDDRASQSL